MVSLSVLLAALRGFSGKGLKNVKKYWREIALVLLALYGVTGLVALGKIIFFIAMC